MLGFWGKVDIRTKKVRTFERVVNYTYNSDTGQIYQGLGTSQFDICGTCSYWEARVKDISRTSGFDVPKSIQVKTKHRKKKGQ